MARLKDHNRYMRERMAKRKKENPHYLSNKNCLRNYGITFEQKQQMIQSQNNCCAICFKKIEHKFDLNVDHDHQTKKLRGILCRKCNIGLGHFNDSLLQLESAITYLRKWSSNG